MKSYKRFLCLVPVVSMLFVLPTACSSDKETPENESIEVTVNDTSTNNPADNNADNTADSTADNADEFAFSYSEGIDENGFLESTKALDYVGEINYRALSIPSSVHEVSDSNLQAEIDNMLAYYTYDEQITDRAVVNGDTVNIDYVGSVDGVEFDGGTTMGMGTDVTIGVKSYIDDFLEQLIGHTPGETINVEVTFPDVYQEESLQGKDAVFVTTLNYILETVQPELTDEFVGANLAAAYGWETVNEMKEAMIADLSKQAVQQYISEYLINEASAGSVPDKLTEYQEKALLQYFHESAGHYGMEFEDFIGAYVGVSNADELIEMYRESNLQNAAYALAIQAVAEDAEISVSEEDMTYYLSDYSQYEEYYGLPYLKQNVLFQKVMDYITENAVLE